MSPTTETRPHRRRLLVLAVGVAALAGAALLYVVDPAKPGVFPPCPFHALTGLHCPGCGSLRATHQLLHGHLAAALRMNPLFVVSLPLLGLLWLFPRWQRKAWVGWLVLAVVVVYWIARNLPFWPLVLLAPH
ncbi:MAG: DUF2752 domain-containing protein [Thermoguttaceae bacterium]